MAASIKVIAASQLGRRDGCDSYDDGTLLFRLIQGETIAWGEQVGHPGRRSDGARRRLSVKEAGAGGLRHLPYLPWVVGCLHARQKIASVGVAAVVRPGDGIHLRHLLSHPSQPPATTYP